MKNIFKNLNVLVIGDLMLDQYFYIKQKKLSTEAPVIIYDYIGESSVLGGAGNVAANIKNLGAKKVTLFSIVEKGDIITSLTKAQNINYVAGNFAPLIEKDRYLVEERQILRIDRDFESCIDEPYFYEILMKLLLEEHFDFVVISDYAKGTIFSDKLFTLLPKDTLVFINGKPKNIKYYSGILLVNHDEFTELNKDKIFSLDYFNNKYTTNNSNLKATIITEGSKGANLLVNNKITFIETNPKKAIDVTGAGDTFISAFSLMFYNTKNYIQSIEFANKAAGVKVGKLKTSTVSYKEL